MAVLRIGQSVHLLSERPSSGPEANALAAFRKGGHAVVAATTTQLQIQHAKQRRDMVII